MHIWCNLFLPKTEFKGKKLERDNGGRAFPKIDVYEGWAC